MLLALLLCGCGGGGSKPEPDTAHPPADTDAPAPGDAELPPEELLEDGDVPLTVFFSEPEGDFDPYEAPPFLDAEYHEDAAEGENGAMLDLSCVGQGYIGVSAVSDSRLKFQVVKDEEKYTYDIASDGEPSIFPLQCGDGEYRFRFMENVADSKYAELYARSCDVKLDDPFEPYLRPSDYVDYTRDSLCVKKAAELAAAAPDALGVVSRVFDLLTSTVVYDREKAANMQAGYLPVPDETMTTGKGICFDYASLAAAMLRSQGIPTKVIFGYVSPNDVYHAWNMFYTEQTGWVTVSYEVSEDSWNRLDLTFSAGGADDQFVGDGENYADLYFY